MSSSTLRVGWYRFRTTSPAVGGDSCRSSCSSAWWAGSPWGPSPPGGAPSRRSPPTSPAPIPPTSAPSPAVINPLIGSTLGYNPKLLHTIAQLPHVRRVGSASGLDVIPVGPQATRSPWPAFPPAAGNGLGK